MIADAAFNPAHQRRRWGGQVSQKRSVEEQAMNVVTADRPCAMVASDTTAQLGSQAYPLCMDPT
jgi:hypothetical protein